jgi:hypothetical protein
MGTDCVATVEAKFADLKADIDTWRAVSLSTDHD